MPQTQAEKNAYLQQPIKCENCEKTISRRSKARHLKCCKGYNYMLKIVEKENKMNDKIIKLAKKVEKETEKENKINDKITKLANKITELENLKKN